MHPLQCSSLLSGRPACCLTNTCLISEAAQTEAETEAWRGHAGGHDAAVHAGMGCTAAAAARVCRLFHSALPQLILHPRKAAMHLRDLRCNRQAAAGRAAAGTPRHSGAATAHHLWLAAGQRLLTCYQARVPDTPLCKAGRSAEPSGTPAAAGRVCWTCCRSRRLQAWPGLAAPALPVPPSALHIQAGALILRLPGCPHTVPGSHPHHPRTTTGAWGACTAASPSPIV